MTLRRLCLTGVLILALAPGRGHTQTARPAAKQVFYYIPHTHWEGAVFKTREEYLEMGLPNILKAIYLLKKYPDYKFTLDQVAYIKPFLSAIRRRHPLSGSSWRRADWE